MGNSNLAKIVDENGESIALTDSPFQIGRSSTASLKIDDSQVSRSHAIIQKDSSNNWWLTDQGSTNGTYLNFRKISQAIILQDGDRIEIGCKELFFYCPQVDTHEDTHAPFTQVNYQTKETWLLVGDIIGSTQMTQESEEPNLATIVGDWAKLCEQVIVEYGGELNKFLGDGFLAYWTGDSSIGQKVGEALVELEQLRLSQDLDFRLVVHFGEVQYGGVMNRGEENLLGDNVNFIFKSEKVASSLGEKTFISSSAAKFLIGRNLKPLGEFETPGFGGKTAFYSLSA